MEYAKDLHSGRIVAAKNASRRSVYVCPRPGCGGQVYLPRVSIQRPHFRHLPGEGTLACDQYFPGTGSSAEVHVPAILAVEENSSELGMLLAQVDGRWGLGLRLPEIPGDELGDMPLATLRSALVDIYAGPDLVTRVSALDLRPGIEAARIDVMPSLQAFRAKTSGIWPSNIEKSRWILESRGIDAKGVLFRLRRGEWTRLLAGSGVNEGETLLILAEARTSIPNSIVTATHARFSGRGLNWTICEIQIPDATDTDVAAWLARLGHEVVPRRWGLELATPARAFTENGDPIFWISDSPVLMIEAPQRNAESLIAIRSESNFDATPLTVLENLALHVKIRSPDAGLARIAVAADMSASLDIAFSRRPTRNALFELLAQTPRLRIWIDEQAIEAWQGFTHKIRVQLRASPEVLVDLGADSARAQITIWERGRRRSRHGLDAGDVERVIETALPSAARIEVDVDNLGKVVLVPVLDAKDTQFEDFARDRLAWRDHIASLVLRSKEQATPILLVQPRVPGSLTMRRVNVATLVRARVAFRGRANITKGRS